MSYIAAIIVLKEILWAKTRIADYHSNLSITVCLKAFFSPVLKVFLCVCVFLFILVLGEGPNWISLGVEIKHMF